MKNIYLTILCSLLIIGNASAQGDAIHFEQGTWSEILSLAKEQNKLVFLDAYTTWCGPCKKMDKEVFTASEVAAVYNKMFINVKMDMEKGEGVELAKTFAVKAYPSLLFVDAKGDLVHRAAGFHSAQEILDLGGEALDPKNRLSTMEERFANGDRDPDFLYSYTMARFEIHDGSHAPIADEYMKTKEDWSTENARKFIFSFVANPHSELFNYLADNQDAFVDMYGQRAVTSKIQELIYNSVQDTKDDSSLDQMDQLFARAYPERAEQLSTRFKMTFYRQAGDREKYADAAIKYFKKFPSDSQEELNEVAWTFLRITKDKKKLKQAVKWAKQSIKLDSNYFNHDTLAALYHRLGKKRKARKTAQKAIVIAKTANIDYSPTEELLQQINGKKVEETPQKG